MARARRRTTPVTTVDVDGRRFRDGDLPRVCAHSGREADALHRLDADHIPTWMWLLLLLGVVPFLVAWVFRPRVEPGWIPLRAASARLLRGYRLGMLLFGPATVVLVGVGLVARQPVAFLLAAMTGFGWVGAAWRHGWHSPAARQLRGDRIRLENVHPAFAAALS